MRRSIPGAAFLVGFAIAVATGCTTGGGLTASTPQGVPSLQASSSGSPTPVVATSWNTVTATSSPVAHRFEIQAHRGGPELGPENSAKVFRRVRDLGVYMVELDVQITSDGVIVVNHDDTIKNTTERRCTNIGLTIHRTPYAKVKSIRCNGEGLPTLKETLDIFRDAGTKLNIEIKPWDNEGTQSETSLRSYAMQVASLMTTGGYRGRYVVSTFEWRTLTRVLHRLDPDLYVIALERSRLMSQPTTRMYSAAREASTLGADAFEIDLAHTQEGFLRYLESIDLDPQLWYVNTPAEARFAIANNINPISTDFPTMIQRVIDEAEKALPVRDDEKRVVRPQAVFNGPVSPDAAASVKVIGRTGLVPVSGQAMLSSVNVSITVEAKRPGTISLSPAGASTFANTTTVDFAKGTKTYYASVQPGNLGAVRLEASSAARLKVSLVSYNRARYRQS